MTEKKKENHTRGYSIYFTEKQDKELRERVRKTDHMKVAVYIRDILFPHEKKEE